MNRVVRSALYLPASNPRAVAKASTLAADAIIFDLEDAVGPAEKASARAAAIEALAQPGLAPRLRVLRINAAGSDWHEADLAACRMAKPDAVLLPKVESAAMLEALEQALPDPDVAIWAMLETPLAVLRAESIAAHAARSERFTTAVVGSNDLRKAAGMPEQPDRQLLLPWLMTLVAASSAYGLQLLDGVYNDFADEAGLLQESLEARAMGMDGKTLIHPAQIAPVNRLWTPTAEEVAAARAIVEVFSRPENAGAGVLQLDGRMVERLHLEQAEALLARVAT